MLRAQLKIWVRCLIISRVLQAIFFIMHPSFVVKTTNYGHPKKKWPSLHGQIFNPNPKSLGTTEAYFVCHISPIFQISLICAFIGCPYSVDRGFVCSIIGGKHGIFSTQRWLSNLSYQLHNHIP